MTQPDLFPLRYVVPVLLALLVAFAWPVTKDIAAASERRRYWLLQIITLVGALAGAKLVVLTGDYSWPVEPVRWADVLLSGRSIVGGLIFGFLTAEIAKPLLGYTLPPNDRFATVLPFSLAIGRIGCHLAGCCRGLPHDGLLSVTYSDGIARWPAQLFEAAFHVAIGLVFIHLLRSRLLQGRLFALFLMVYGVYRFGSEMIRETPRVLHGYSVYQAWCLVMIALGALSFALRSRRNDGPLRAAAV